MRTTWNRLIALFTLLGAGVFTVALADTPADPAAASPAAPAATSTSSTPATAAATSANAATASSPAHSAAASAGESDTALEKRLTNSGYKPRMRNGHKVWCKQQGELGSRLGGQEVCGTPDELRLNVQQQQDNVRSVQKLYNATAK
jgi:ABC-type sugar transport system substrate-binding protein